MIRLLACTVLCAAVLPAQGSPAPKNAKPLAPTPAAAAAAAATQGAVHASLAALQRDFQEKKVAALDAYAKANAGATDAAEALAEAASLSKQLGRAADVRRFTEAYLAKHGDGDAAGAMRLARAESLRDLGDGAAAEAALREVIAKAGDDINGLVEATTTLASMLVDGGKKDDAKALLTEIGEANGRVRGLKEHFAKVAESYDVLGTEPKPIGLPDTDGKVIDLAAYKGKVVLVDFWATWCGPCIAELPNVIAAYDKYHAQGFEIVGISLDEDRAKLDAFVKARKITWRQHFDGKGWQNEAAQAWGIQSIPATFLIGADGKIVATDLRGQQLDQKLAKLLPAKK
ncbi:MAG: redoxin family protein [Planctomycetota bacterium]